MTEQRFRAPTEMSLVLLRTLIGWQFLYEGWVKLIGRAWARDGSMLAPWSAAGFLESATGPLAPVFHWMGDESRVCVLDWIVVMGLVAIGLSLILGLFTQTGATGAVIMLLLFWLAQIPTLGVQQPGAEGTYLIVSKNLVEAAAAFVVLVSRTGRIAGLDLLLQRRRTRAATEA